MERGIFIFGQRGVKLRWAIVTTLGLIWEITQNFGKIDFSKFFLGGGVGKKFWKKFFLVKISTKNFFFRKKNPITQNIRIADSRENVDFWGSVQKRCYMGFLTTFWHYFWIFPHMCMPGSVPSKFRKNQNDLETSSK